MTNPLVYKVTADFKPFQSRLILADSESEARIEGAKQLGVTYEETAADIVGNSEFAWACLGKILNTIHS